MDALKEQRLVRAHHLGRQDYINCKPLTVPLRDDEQEVYRAGYLGEARRATARGRRAVLKGHPYHDRTDDELRFIIKDAGEAAFNMRGLDPVAEAKYLDQINNACSILHARHR